MRTYPLKSPGPTMPVAVDVALAGETAAEQIDVIRGLLQEPGTFTLPRIRRLLGCWRPKGRGGDSARARLPGPRCAANTAAGRPCKRPAAGGYDGGFCGAHGIFR
ncbi:hypothetical protein LCGC14_2922970 [marine sediment metagenome]|uniref:Uncharacterized protein n=1 Tax=marine sediment metagenome TaxID=412755 RepID=A0A0F8XNK1_9ZZZZ